MKSDNAASKAYIYDQQQMLHMLENDGGDNSNISKPPQATDNAKNKKTFMHIKKYIKKVNVFAQLSTLCFTSMLFFGFLFESAYVGITFGIYGFIHAIVEHIIKKKDFKKGSTLSRLVENDSVLFLTMLKKNLGIYFVVYVITSSMFLAPGISALSNPSSKNYTLYGDQTYLLIYIQIATVPFLNLFYIAGMRFNRIVIKYISRTCKKKIEEYIKKIRDTLLIFDVENGNKEKCWQDIYEVQKDVEQWAHDINKSMSTSNGVQLLLNLTITTIMILLTSILQLGNKDGKSTWKILLTAFIGVLFLAMFIRSLNEMTKPNTMWEKNCKIMLNDSRIQFRIYKTFGTRITFDKWLNNHELNSQRAFGFKITVSTLVQMSTAVLSIFTIAVYYIMREELRGIMG